MALKLFLKKDMVRFLIKMVKSPPYLLGVRKTTSVTLRFYKFLVLSHTSSVISPKLILTTFWEFFVFFAQFPANFPILYHLNIFRGYKLESLVRYGLMFETDVKSYKIF